MLEKDLERKLVRQIEKAGGLCWKFTSPGTVGVPDRIVMLPGGRIVFVEMKQEFGRVQNIQKYRQKQLLTVGFDARVIKGEKALQAFLDEIKEVMPK